MHDFDDPNIPRRLGQLSPEESLGLCIRCRRAFAYLPRHIVDQSVWTEVRGIRVCDNPNVFVRCPKLGCDGEHVIDRGKVRM